MIRKKESHCIMSKLEMGPKPNLDPLRPRSRPRLGPLRPRSSPTAHFCGHQRSQDLEIKTVTLCVNVQYVSVKRTLVHWVVTFYGHVSLSFFLSFLCKKEPYILCISEWYKMFIAYEPQTTLWTILWTIIYFLFIALLPGLDSDWSIVAFDIYIS